MKLFQSLASSLAIICLAALQSQCGGSSGGSDSGSRGATSLANTQPITVVGTLAVDPNNANKDTLIKNQEVNLEDPSGKIVASGVSDSKGNFSVQAPGELIISTSIGLQLSGDYQVTSVIEDDGNGKVLGISQSISLVEANVKAGTIKTGVLAFAEISAIAGKIKFIDADGSENTKLPKVGTEVYLAGYSLIAKTDSEGKFLILYVPPATYTMRIERGTLAKEQSVTVTANTTLNLGTISVLADSIPPITTASKASTDFKNALCVALSSSETGSSIYYSTDGSTPTASNPFLYDAKSGGGCGSVAQCAICVSSKSTTLKFFGVDPSGNVEDLNSSFYFYNEKWADPSDTTVPTTTLLVNSTSPPTPAVYLTPPTFILTSSESGSTYYTTNPAATIGQFTSYSGPVQISTSSTLRWYSTDYAGNIESIHSKQIKVYSWTKLAATGPSAAKPSSNSEMRIASMTYDSNRAKAILGTYNGTNDTFYLYRWNGSAWTQETSQTSFFVSKFMNFQLYYNTDFQKVYFTAPVTGGSVSYKTWDYDSTGPAFSVRNSGGNATWDSATFMAFGGLSGIFSPLDHSFVAISPTNGSTKLQRLYLDPGNVATTNAYESSAQSSSIKDVGIPMLGRAVYVSKSGAEKMIFFGGSSGGHGITYELPRAQFSAASGSPSDPTWTENITSHIPAVGCPELAYLASQDRVIAFGGHNSPVTLQGGTITTSFSYSATDQTWSYDGTDWTLLAPATSPTPRYCATSTYDPASESILLFGGYDRYGNVLTDTWVFGY